MAPLVGKTYRHFKGRKYVVEQIKEPTDITEVWATFADGAVARLTDAPEITETHVLYRSLEDDGPTWARPLSEWEKPLPNGGVRFQLEI